MNMSYDRHNKYSLPYFFGTVGILYNKRFTQMKTLVVGKHYIQPKYKNDILLVDGAREIMGLALNKLGYSLNDTNPSHLKKQRKI